MPGGGVCGNGGGVWGGGGVIAAGVKYLKCCHENCDGSAKLVDDKFLVGVRAIILH